MITATLKKRSIVSRTTQQCLPAALMVMAASTGCSNVAPTRIIHVTGGSAALFNQFRAYDGETGRLLSFTDVVERAGRADVVLFGEEHSNQVCNALEAQLLVALNERRRGSLADRRRPVTLAMEFFESDTQPALDAYLEGRMDEPEFRTLARQKRAYLTAHRPLIEYCRHAGIPVIAANAPARLIKAYRTSGLDYDEFRASVEPADRAWLPRTSDMLEGAYYERFVEAMSHHPAPTSAPASQPVSSPATQPASPPGPNATSSPATASDSDQNPLHNEGASHAAEPATPASGSEGDAPFAAPAEAAATQPASHSSHNAHSHAHGPPTSQPSTQPGAEERMLRSYRIQLLWDDAMSESISNHRARYPDRRIMLVVGVFHIERDGGTKAKLRQRRPDDTVCTIVFRGISDTSLQFDESDRGAGDVVIYGITPPQAHSGT